VLPSVEYSYPVKAATDILAVRYEPLTEMVCAVEAVPEHFEKELKVPEDPIFGDSPDLFLPISILSSEKAAKSSFPSLSKSTANALPYEPK
jgi:hypothetical protein